MLAAIAAVTLVLAGCDEALLEAKVQAKHAASRYTAHRSPGARRNRRLVQLLLGTVTPPGRRPTPPSAGFGGLQARIQQATDEAAASGATLSVAVLDRKTA